VYFCSRGIPEQWRELWNWKFSETMEFMIERNRDAAQLLRDLKGLDIKYLEQETNAVLKLILMRI
jgi:hypothetical protein